MAQETGILSAIKSIGKGLGAIYKTVTDSTAFKAIKFGLSATIGIPLGVAVSAGAAVGFGFCKVMSIIDSRIIQPNTWWAGKMIINDQWWEKQANWWGQVAKDYWLDFGIGAYLDTADWIRDNWAERQEEAGYGTEDAKKPAKTTKAEDDIKHADEIFTKTPRSIKPTKIEDIELTLNDDSSTLKTQGTAPALPSGKKLGSTTTTEKTTSHHQ